MKHEIKILPAAWEDLKRIEDYYILDFGVESALKVLDGILDAVERLADFPDSGSSTPDEWLNSHGYKMVISKEYVAIYKKIGDDIYVYHIANTQTEYTKLFYKQEVLK